MIYALLGMAIVVLAGTNFDRTYKANPLGVG